MSTETKKTRTSGASGLVFVGCLLIGLAVGILTGQVAAALLIALGVGFIGMAIVRLGTGEW
ncbi:MAG: hypothetical protein H6649_00220 [Caldilineae bacterium]|nr:hypothetical protein [Anaerolineae bacterium]MCB0205504.1 hypothetical protein [Anaerolineae bacterium]MCB0253622.1 hypothetical protein [Anaerolineae bacterium]MCB9152466.1 hypothetical protein [Caldilineae bacterium]